MSNTEFSAHTIKTRRCHDKYFLKTNLIDNLFRLQFWNTYVELDNPNNKKFQFYNFHPYASQKIGDRVRAFVYDNYYFFNEQSATITSISLIGDISLLSSDVFTFNFASRSSPYFMLGPVSCPYVEDEIYFILRRQQVHS